MSAEVPQSTTFHLGQAGLPPKQARGNIPRRSSKTILEANSMGIEIKDPELQGYADRFAEAGKSVRSLTDGLSCC